MISIDFILLVSTLMMFAGVYGFLTRKSTLAILLSIELMLNAANINFAVFNNLPFPDGHEGVLFAIFAIDITAAESAIAIAIMINIYRQIQSISVDKLTKMKW